MSYLCRDVSLQLMDPTLKFRLLVWSMWKSTMGWNINLVGISQPTVLAEASTLAKHCCGRTGISWSCICWSHRFSLGFVSPSIVKPTKQGLVVRVSQRHYELLHSCHNSRSAHSAFAHDSCFILSLTYFYIWKRFTNIKWGIKKAFSVWVCKGNFCLFISFLDL